MTDGERLTALLAQYAIPCEKVSFHGKLDALAGGLGIQTSGRLLGDVLDDIAQAKRAFRAATGSTARSSAGCTRLW